MTKHNMYEQLTLDLDFGMIEQTTKKGNNNEGI